MPVQVRDLQGGAVTVTGGNVASEKSWVTIVPGNPVAIHGEPKTVSDVWLLFTVYFRGLGQGPEGAVNPVWTTEEAYSPDAFVSQIVAQSRYTGYFQSLIGALHINGAQHGISVVAQSAPYPPGSAAWYADLAIGVSDGTAAEFSMYLFKNSVAYWPIDGEWMQIKITLPF